MIIHQTEIEIIRIASASGCDNVARIPRNRMKVDTMKAAAPVFWLLLFGIPLDPWVYAVQTEAAVFSPAPANPQSASSGSIWSGVYTSAQAGRGKELYQARCGSCHGDKLVSDSDAPALTAPAFKFSWQKKTLAERFERIRTTMPPGENGELSVQECVDIIGYILQFNGYPSGNQELKPEKNALEKIIIEPAP
jgi:mono/diheme cytochrome c family protein